MGGECFIVFEGIDGSGKTTQILELERAIKKINKYQDVLTTREPTWRADELKRKLERDGCSHSDGIEMARLFVEDRRIHLHQINSARYEGELVICDRFAMSTLAYQSAQGVPLAELLRLHEEAGITGPDITFYVRVDMEIAMDRARRRGDKLEKFEKDPEFIRRLVESHDYLADLSKEDPSISRFTGKVYTIDGSQSVEQVAKDVGDIALPFYSEAMKRNT